MAHVLNANERSTWTARHITGAAFKWIGRGVSAALLFVWGAYFVEHLGEWFVVPATYPPAVVWEAMGAHFGILVGLALLVWWDRIGAAIVVLATAVFIALTGFDWSMIALAVPANLLPVACVVASRLMLRTRPD